MGELVQNIILWLTGVILLWYTWETYNLRKIAEVQGITSIRPYLRLQTIDGEDNKLRLVNEGKGVAVNLKVKYSNKEEMKILKSITAMAAAPGSYTDLRSLGVDFNTEKDFTIEVKYLDMEKRNYIAFFKSNTEFNDKFEIIRQNEENEV